MAAPTINSGHVTKADTSATTSRTINVPTHATGDYIFLAITADAGLTVNSSGIAAGGTKVVAWLSGGTVGETYKVAYHITTSLGRQEDRTIIIEIAQK